MSIDVFSLLLRLLPMLKSTTSVIVWAAAHAIDHVQYTSRDFEGWLASLKLGCR